MIEIFWIDDERDVPFEQLSTLQAEIQDLHVKIGAEVFRDDVSSDELTRYLREVIADPELALVTASADGTVAGYAIVEAGSRKATLFKRASCDMYVHQIGVARDGRGRGVGKSLMQAIETRAAEQGCDGVTLSSWCANENAQTFFVALGYDATIVTRTKRL